MYCNCEQHGLRMAENGKSTHPHTHSLTPSHTFMIIVIQFEIRCDRPSWILMMPFPSFHRFLLLTCKVGMRSDSCLGFMYVLFVSLMGKKWTNKWTQ